MAGSGDGEKESAALQKLRAAAGFVDKPQVERLDWMYEQSALQLQKDEDKLMNTPIDAPKDKDIEDVKSLNESTPGSVFLKSATKTTEDMLRKLREDPLFQIRRQEQLARENMMANPLVLAKMNKKAEKEKKKEQKKAKKAEKKAKKAAKKVAKAEGKGKKKKKKGSSSSSSGDSTASVPAKAKLEEPASKRARASSPSRGAALGPAADMVDKRAEHAAQIAARRDAALASRGAARRMSEEERQRRLEEMREDARKHERHKDTRIAAAEKYDQEVEEKEREMRAKSDQSYFREIRTKAYMGDEGASVADRLKTQRHRRGKNLNDPLERDG